MKKIISLIMVLSLVIACSVISTPVSAGEFSEATPDYWDGTAATEFNPVGAETNYHPLGDSANLDTYNVYEVSNAQELRYVFNLKNMSNIKIVLIDDIYLNNTTDFASWNLENGTRNNGADNLHKWTQQTNQSIQKFELDGQGHIIYGMYINNLESEGLYYGGLFSRLETSVANATETTDRPFVIRNLGIDYSYISARYAAAFVAGGNQQGSDNATSNPAADFQYGNSFVFENCFVGDNVTLKGKALGGFIAKDKANSSSLKLTNCYSNVNLVQTDTTATNSEYVKGTFGGYLNNRINFKYRKVEMSNCYSVTDDAMFGIWGPHSSNSAPILDATTNFATVAYTGNQSKPYTTALTQAQMKGLNALINMKGLGDAYVVTVGEYPQLKLFLDTESSPNNYKVIGKDEPFNSGKGTEADPYIISNSDDLKTAVGYYGFGGKYFKLIDNISVNAPDAIDYTAYQAVGASTLERWFPSDLNTSGLNYYVGLENDKGQFSGHIDGDGYTIEGIYYPDYSYNSVQRNAYTLTSGLIPVMEEGSIKNLILANSHFSSTGYGETDKEARTGALIGKIPTTGKTVDVENVIIESTVGVAVDSGSDRNFKSCGGVVGFVNGTSSSAHATLNLKNVGVKCVFNYTDYPPVIGGLVGRNNGTLNADMCYTVDIYPQYIWRGSAPAPVYNITNTYTDFDYTKTLEEKNYKDDSGNKPIIANLADIGDALEKTDQNSWYGTGTSPMLRFIGKKIHDINEDGIGSDDGDVNAIRSELLSLSKYYMSDINNDGDVNIIDLVQIKRYVLNHLFTSYNLNLFTSPVWEGDDVYYETVAFVENSKGVISDAKLLYKDGVKIKAIRSLDMKTTYEEGKDYTVNNGVITLTNNSAIKHLAYNDYTTANADSSIAFIDNDNIGTIIDATETRYLVKGGTNCDARNYQVTVCYTHTDSWKGTVPTSQLSKLTKLKAKIDAGEEISIVYIGDSITAGADASGNTETTAGPRDTNGYSLEKVTRDNKGYANVPAWTQMVGQYFTKNTNVKMTYVNAGSPSTYSGDGNNQKVIDTWIIPNTPDLVVISFGMNELRTDTKNKDNKIQNYENNIRNIITMIRNNKPDTEFLLLSAMTPSDLVTKYVDDENNSILLDEYEDVNEKISGDTEGVGSVPINSIFTYINSTGKKFMDYTSNKINHPNDFGVMIYAQSVIAALGGYENR